MEIAASQPQGPAVQPARRMVSFVLPVYNEEGNLREMHRKITDVMRGQPDAYEIVFVDDGSTDRSVEVMTELRQQDRRVRAILLRRNFGKAAAYSAGFDNANGEIVVTMDADLQDDPAEIPEFIKKMDEGYDMVIGWKYEGKGPLGKSLPSKFFNRVVQFITGIPLHDFNCPFKAYRKEVLQEIHVYGELHRYIPVLARSRGFSFAEIKIRNLPRLSGTSKYGLERYMRGMLDLLTISFITRFAKRPMHLLGVGGVIACALGLGSLGALVGGHLLYETGIVLDRSWNLHERPLMTIGFLLAVVGAQFFSMGLLGELFISGSGSGSQKDRGYSIKKILEE